MSSTRSSSQRASRPTPTHATRRPDRCGRRILASPRVAASEKNRILALALEGQVPQTFLRFIQAMVKNRRQLLIPMVATEYHTLVDVVRYPADCVNPPKDQPSVEWLKAGMPGAKCG